MNITQLHIVSKIEFLRAFEMFKQQTVHNVFAITNHYIDDAVSDLRTDAGTSIAKKYYSNGSNKEVFSPEQFKTMFNIINFYGDITESYAREFASKHLGKTSVFDP